MGSRIGFFPNMTNMNNLTSIFQYPFIQHALLAGLLVSIACGIIGCYVVVKRIVFLSGGIAHAAYGGIGLGYFLHFNPFFGAIFFSLFTSLLMGTIEKKAKQRSDTVIGVIWSVGMAIGIILIDLTKGYKTDLMSYLFGSILTVPVIDLWIMVVLNIVIILLIAKFYRVILSITFDESYAITQNVPVNLIESILLCLTALTIVLAMRIVGLILVMAMLTIPASIAGEFTKDLRKMMGIASLLGICFTCIGLWISYQFNLTAGACIILVSAIAYSGVLLLKKKA